MHNITTTHADFNSVYMDTVISLCKLNIWQAKAITTSVLKKKYYTGTLCCPALTELKTVASASWYVQLTAPISVGERAGCGVYNAISHMLYNSPYENTICRVAMKNTEQFKSHAVISSISSLYFHFKCRFISTIAYNLYI